MKKTFITFGILATLLSACKQRSIQEEIMELTATDGIVKGEESISLAEKTGMIGRWYDKNGKLYIAIKKETPPKIYGSKLPLLAYYTNHNTDIVNSGKILNALIIKNDTIRIADHQYFFYINGKMYVRENRRESIVSRFDSMKDNPPIWVNEELFKDISKN